MSRALPAPACARRVDLVLNPVHHGLPKIGLQRCVRSILEYIDLLQRADHRFLDEIVGIDQGACPGGQPAACPAFEGRNRAGEDFVERREIASARLRKQLNRRCFGGAGVTRRATAFVVTAGLFGHVREF